MNLANRASSRRLNQARAPAASSTRMISANTGPPTWNDTQATTATTTADTSTVSASGQPRSALSSVQRSRWPRLVRSRERSSRARSRRSREVRPCETAKAICARRDRSPTSTPMPTTTKVRVASSSRTMTKMLMAAPYRRNTSGTDCPDMRMRSA
jgi:hypothetical protein